MPNILKAAGSGHGPGRGPGPAIRLTRGDRALAAVVLVACGASLAWRLAWAPAAETVRVEVAGRLVGEYPLVEARSVRIAGPAGTSVVEIGPDGARIAVAPCPQQTCRRQGWVRRQGESIVCVPNQLIVTVTGNAGRAAVDAVSR